MMVTVRFKRLGIFVLASCCSVIAIEESEVCATSTETISGSALLQRKRSDASGGLITGQQLDASSFEALVQSTKRLQTIRSMLVAEFDSGYGNVAPLTEQGFWNVVGMYCPMEMERWFNRLVGDLGFKICSKPHVQGLMHWFIDKGLQGLPGAPVMNYQYAFELIRNGNPCKYWAPIGEMCPVIPGGSEKCAGNWCGHGLDYDPNTAPAQPATSGPFTFPPEEPATEAPPVTPVTLPPEPPATEAPPAAPATEAPQPPPGGPLGPGRPQPGVPQPSETEAPPTEVPVLPPTEAPVLPPTEAPVLPPTEAPVLPPTEAPVLPPTEAPVLPPTEAPPTEAPEPPQTMATPTEAPEPPPTIPPIEVGFGQQTAAVFHDQVPAVGLGQQAAGVGSWSRKLQCHDCEKSGAATEWFKSADVDACQAACDLAGSKVAAFKQSPLDTGSNCRCYSEGRCYSQTGVCNGDIYAKVAEVTSLGPSPLG